MNISVYSGSVTRALKFVGAGAIAVLLAALAQPAPAQNFSAPDIEVEEGGVAEFKLELPNAFTADIRYQYTTEDDTATAGDDYTKGSGHAVFSANTKTTEVEVKTTTDCTEEGNERFKLKLSNMETRGFAANHNNWTSAFSLQSVPSSKTIYAVIKDKSPGSITACGGAD